MNPLLLYYNKAIERTVRNLSIIKVSVRDQMLTVTEAPKIASGGLYENKMAFEFCEKWDGFSKTGVFYNVPYKPYKRVIGEDGVCVVPPEVTAKKGNMYFGVVGVNAEGITRTSLVISYFVDEGANDSNAVISNPTPEIWQQCLAEIAKTMVATQEARDEVAKVISMAEDAQHVAEEAKDLAGSHAENHGKGGKDYISPDSIGAANKEHEHYSSEIKDFPDIDRAYVDENGVLHIKGFTPGGPSEGEVSDEKIAEAVEEYFKEHPGAGGGLSTNGIPAGGTAGQYLRKVSNSDYDVEWADLEIPAEYGLVSYDNTKTLTIT